MIDVICMGRIGMDLYPSVPGPLEEVATFHRSLGGTAANVAVAAARLGHRAALVSKVGDDRVGVVIRSELVDLGVDASMVGTDQSLLTPIVIAELDPPAEPRISFYRSPSAPDLQLHEHDLEADRIAEARILWVTGTGLSAEPSRSTTLAAMRMHEVGDGRDTVLDLDWRASLWGRGEVPARWYAEAIEHASVVVGNRAEVAVALGLGEAAGAAVDPGLAADELLARGPRLACVKLGADGVLLASGTGERVRIEPIVVDVVCGLGAGDAFGGALCHGLLEGMDLARLGRTCNAAGALVAGRLACANAMPTLDELHGFLQANDLASMSTTTEPS